MIRISSCLFLVLLSLSMPASAVQRSAGPDGEVLLVPFFAVGEGRTTLLAITNQRERPKAVKVRLHESLGGRTLLQFNVYLAARDQWSAILFQQEGLLALGSRDASCTVPALVDDPGAPQVAGLRFWPASMADFTGARADGLTEVPGRTSSGSIEIFEMGEVVGGSGEALSFGPAATIPARCGQLQAAFTATEAAGYWRTDPSRDLTAPTGGLSAEASIIHVRGGWSLEVPVTALAGFRATGAAILHTPPGSPHPRLDDTLGDVATGSAFADVVDAQGIPRRLVYPRARAIDAVSAVLAATALQGLHSDIAAIGSATAWVVSSPTRRFQTDPELVSDGPAGTDVPRAWLENFGTGGSRAGMGPPPECVGATTGPDCPWVDLPHATNVLEFAGSSGVSGGTVLPSMARLGLPRQPRDRPEGRARLRFLDGQAMPMVLRADQDGQVLQGYPVLGFSAIRYALSDAMPGVMAVFGDIKPLFAGKPVLAGAGAAP